MIRVTLSENGKGFFITKRHDDPLLTQRQLFLTPSEFMEVMRQGMEFVHLTTNALRSREDE